MGGRGTGVGGKTMLAEKTFKNLEYHSCLIEASFSDSLNLVTIAAIFRDRTKYYVIS